MPRCEECQRQQPSSEVRKMPSRDSHRCKDRFDCELARTNRDPYTATIEITFPAKSHREAWSIVDGLDKSLAPSPCSVVKITDGDSVTYSKSEAIAVEVGDTFLDDVLNAKRPAH